MREWTREDDRVLLRNLRRHYLLEARNLLHLARLLAEPSRTATRYSAGYYRSLARTLRQEIRELEAEPPAPTLRAVLTLREQWETASQHARNAEGTATEPAARQRERRAWGIFGDAKRRRIAAGLQPE